jgi:hypothetical protein
LQLNGSVNRRELADSDGGRNPDDSRNSIARNVVGDPGCLSHRGEIRSNDGENLYGTPHRVTRESRSVGRVSLENPEARVGALAIAVTYLLSESGCRWNRLVEGVFRHQSANSYP